MADITIMGANYADVPKIVVPATGGGTASFYSMDQELSWMAPEIADSSTIYEEDFLLKNTSFPSWSPSTTASIIINYNALPSFSVTLGEYNVLVNWLTDIDVAYDGAQASTYYVQRYVASQWQLLHRRPYGLANITAMTDSYNYSANAWTASSYTFYHGKSGTDTWTSGLSYGFYATVSAATFDSTTNATTNATVRVPAVSARASSGYMTTANFGHVDTEKTTIRMRGIIYKIPPTYGQVRQFYRVAADLYSHPIQPLPPVLNVSD